MTRSSTGWGLEFFLYMLVSISIKIFSLVCSCWTKDLGFRALGCMKPTHAISWSSISVFFICPNKSYSYIILSKGSIISKELNGICLISIHCNLLWTKVCRVLYSFIELCLLMMLQFNYTAFSLIVMLPFKFIKSINITVSSSTILKPHYSR